MNSDTIPDEVTWQKAAAAAGIIPGLPVSDEMWLAAWTAYGKSRLDMFRKYVSGIRGVLAGLRDELHRITERMSQRKARLADINRLAAIGIEHDVTPLRQYASRARRVEKAALEADEKALATLIVGLQNQGIGEETQR